jgi:fatty acid desaturase
VDHRSFLAALPADLRIGLTAPDDRPARRRLALHGGAILAGGLWIAAGLPFWWAWLPLHGTLIAFLFAVEHEATHRTLLSNTRANDAAGRVCGFLLLLPFEWFRWFHMAHHRHTNDPARDPELQGGAKPATRAATLLHLSGLPYWLAEARVVWRLAAGGPLEGFVPAAAAARTRAEARAMLAGYALVAASLAWTGLALWVWLLPVAIGQMPLRLFLLAEHADCPRVANMFENTRTTFTTRLLRLVTWNASFHVEHHVHPQVPFHRLPALHRLMRAELRVTADGYAAFARDYLARHRGA